ncbi:AlbA family DNA-binding domain-containing protein, partial [Endothiovibrio diazotrophicus]
MISEANVRRLLAAGEGLQVEFKRCRDALNRDVFESVCAFLNRSGGDLLLGVADDGSVVGVDPSAAAQLKRDFVTALNNPQKIAPPFYLDISEQVIDGVTLLH